jgi:hypothetical protein
MSLVTLNLAVGRTPKIESLEVKGSDELKEQQVCQVNNLLGAMPFL